MMVEVGDTEFDGGRRELGLGEIGGVSEATVRLRVAVARAGPRSIAAAAAEVAAAVIDAPALIFLFNSFYVLLRNAIGNCIAQQATGRKTN